MNSRNKLYAVIVALGGVMVLFGKITTASADANDNGGTSEPLFETQLMAEKIKIPAPDLATRILAQTDISDAPNTKSTGEARGHVLDGVKYIYYKTVVWGEIEADFNEFRKNTKETLNDERGWARAGLKFVEVDNKQDLNIILSDEAHLDATNGCSADLSCTTWNNEVIINDLRWREGTEASRAAGMETREYQHMVINHEVGHWLGHYAHETSCESGGPAPVMLQQSTGLRGCDSFNAWPLESELWTLR